MTSTDASGKRELAPRLTVMIVPSPRINRTPRKNGRVFSPDRRWIRPSGLMSNSRPLGKSSFTPALFTRTSTPPRVRCSPGTTLGSNPTRDRAVRMRTARTPPFPRPNDAGCNLPSLVALPTITAPELEGMICGVISAGATTRDRQPSETEPSGRESRIPITPGLSAREPEIVSIPTEGEPPPRATDLPQPWNSRTPTDPGPQHPVGPQRVRSSRRLYSAHTNPSLLPRPRRLPSIPPPPPERTPHG